MSKRRAAILSVVVEGRTQAETARQHKVSESTVSRWVARYRAEGDTAFETRSRRPRTAPTAIPDETVELVVNLRAELEYQGLHSDSVWSEIHDPRGAITMRDLPTPVLAINFPTTDLTPINGPT